MAARDNSKTRLLQIRISSPADAPLAFQQHVQEDAIPLVLVPDDRWCTSCCLTVPQGPYCILHRFGKDVLKEETVDQNGNKVVKELLAEPGLQCTPAYNRIAYCVSAQACTYNASVKSCPTRDNVMVDCELKLTFEIGDFANADPNVKDQAPAQVKKFVYTLGAIRFDEFLSAAVEETIRHLVRTCKHDEVYELRGGSDERVTRTLVELQRKFEPFGVFFRTAAITDVRFNAELQNILQETTEFKSKIKKQRKMQKHTMDSIQFDADKMMESKIKDHERKLQELQAARARALINRDKRKTDTQSQCDVEQLQEEERAKTEETRAQSKLQVAEAQAQRKAEEILARARADAAKVKIKAAQEAKTMIFESEKELEAAQKLADALIAGAEAEEQAAASLKIKREYDLELAKSEVLQALAKKSKMVVSGANGDRLIESMLNSGVLGDIQLS